jgi:hypothetical protein
VGWKPSRNTIDDKKKAQALEQKAALDKQIEDTKRIKREENNKYIVEK